MSTGDIKGQTEPSLCLSKLFPTSAIAFTRLCHLEYWGHQGPLGEIKESTSTDLCWREEKTQRMKTISHTSQNLRALTILNFQRETLRYTLSLLDLWAVFIFQVILQQSTYYSYLVDVPFTCLYPINPSIILSSKWRILLKAIQPIL